MTPSSWAAVVAMLLAGGAGAVSRFLLDAALRARVRSALPVGTIVINVLGSLMLGALTAAALRHGLSREWLLVAGTGFCGGFTTFSTASVEIVRLVRGGRAVLALGVAVAQAMLCVASAALGFWLLA